MSDPLSQVPYVDPKIVRPYINRPSLADIGIAAVPSTDTNEGLYQNRIRKLERVTSDLVAATVDAQNEVGTAAGRPGTPTGVTAVYTVGQTVIRWEKAKNCASYEVVFSEWANVAIAGRAGLTASDSLTHLVDGARYYWVRGLNARGEVGDWSTMCLATAGSSTVQEAIDEFIATSPILDTMLAGITESMGRIANIESYIASVGGDPSGIVSRLISSIEGELPHALLETILFAQVSRENARNTNAIIRQSLNTWISDIHEVFARVSTELQSQVDTTRANILQEATTRASEDAAIASDLTFLSGTVANNYASIVDSMELRVAPLEAEARKIAQIEVDVAGNTAAVAEESNARVVLDGKVDANHAAITAEHIIKVQAQRAGGKPVIAGIGMVANSEGISEVLVAANRFAVVDPLDSAGSSITVPFLVMNGTVYINAACIANASITGAHIANATITNANIGAAAIKSANIEDAAITTAKIGNAQITKAKMASAYISDLQAETAQIANASIAAATIQWAQIQQAIINNLEVDTAHIKKLTVDESNIVAGACSAANMAVNSYGGQLDSTWTTYASTSVTVSATKTIYIQASGLSCSGSISGVGSWASHVRVMCGSTTVIPDTPCAHWTRAQLLEGLLMPFVLAGKFNPSSAGTYTFDLQARWPGGSYGSPSPGWESVIGRSSISAWQFKK